MMMSSLAAACTVSLILMALPKATISNPGAPCNIGKLSFAIESEDVSEDCGVELVLESVQSMPVYLRYDDADPSKKYTLLMVDPDAASSKAPEKTYFLHWLLEQVPGKELQSGKFKNSEEDEPVETTYVEKISYMPPNPPAGSGPHRYQFYLYEQSVPTLNGIPGKTRGGFDMEDFVSINSLGSPVAAFEFVAENLSSGDL
ncbi:protein D1-like [Liolophura sinensis]|uniref:protein D1-like n=1 Tax=Liolophura sinensis TaxID=3198878 RepID=UPI003158F1BB